MAQWQRLSTVDQFTAFLRAEILSGRWTGVAPGVHRLSAEFGINRKTVEACLQRLEAEGLLVGQGAGRRRRIELPGGKVDAPAMRIAVLGFDSGSQGIDYVIDLRHRLEALGHIPFFTDKCLLDLGRNVGRVARYVKKTEADAWIVCSGSHDILEWFAQQEVPAFALFGVRDGVRIAAAGPDKTEAIVKLTRRLVELGHRRISLIGRHEVREPRPSKGVRAYLEELEAAGMEPAAYHLPDWVESPEGFEDLLKSMFAGPTPPTALILDEAFEFNAAYHHVSQLGMRVPQDISLVCTDSDPSFVWCKPEVSHIRWDSRPVVRRIVNWANNVARGRDDWRQGVTKSEFVEGGTIGPVLG